MITSENIIQTKLIKKIKKLHQKSHKVKFQKISYLLPPTEGNFALDPHPLGISILGDACHPPPRPPLDFPKFSFLVRYPLEGIFQLKVLLHYTIMPKIFVY